MPKSWYDLTSKLSCFGDKAGPTEAALDDFLKGVDLNQASSDNRLLITQMAWDGRADSVDYLLKRGADPNKVSTPYANGPALAHAVEGSSTKPAVKVEVVKRLLAGGANPNAPVGAGMTLLDVLVSKAVDAANPRENHSAKSRRYYKMMLQGYLATIPLLVAAGGTMSDTSKISLEELLLPPMATPFDLHEVRALIEKADRDAIYQLCETHLATAEAIAHPEWSTLVTAAIDAGPSFRSVAKEVYGKEVTLTDDEGWLCQSWDNYVTLDVIFEMLANEIVVRHPQWSELMAYALQCREAHDATSYTADALDELFAKSWVGQHPDYKKLRALEQETN